MSSIRKAVILAAGKGTRMGDLTRDIPKPMLPVGGKPILEHVLDRLRAAGVGEILLVVGYYGDEIRRHFADYPLPIVFKEQKVVNGTGAAAGLARDFAGRDPFLLTFGDILCSVADYHGLFAALDEAADGVLGAKYVDDPWQGAAIYVEDERVVRVIEKPPRGTSLTHWNSAGLYVFRSVLFDELRTVPLSVRGEYELTSAVEQLIAHGRTLRLYGVQEGWLDVGRPEDLQKAEGLV
ncbi:MAG: NTP transferase domain-containing protein [Acidobacteria bacterium]|nr:NTP transferase domain-containing protein [Acidobacteriota bacterium]